jgi:hypothetical protein
MPKKPDAKSSKRDQLPIAVELIERHIFLIRGQKIMLDSDLAELYQVPTKAFNQAVKRNLGRFPSDFMFQLCAEEMELLDRSQIVTGSQKHRDPRYLPYAFTEHGVAMLSAVLRSDRAVHRFQNKPINREHPNFYVLAESLDSGGVRTCE